MSWDLNEVMFVECLTHSSLTLRFSFLHYFLPFLLRSSTRRFRVWHAIFKKQVISLLSFLFTSALNLLLCRLEDIRYLKAEFSKIWSSIRITWKKLLSVYLCAAHALTLRVGLDDLVWVSRTLKISHVVLTCSWNREPLVWKENLYS